MMNGIRPSEALRGVRHILIEAIGSRTPLTLDDSRVLSDALAEIIPAVGTLERAAEAALRAESHTEQAARLARASSVCGRGGQPECAS